MIKMLIYNSIVLIFTTLFTNKVNGYELPACTESIHGRYPYAESCTKYFECKYGQVTVSSCIPGLAYNSFLGVCDFPAKVKGCEYVQIQAKTVIVCPKNFIGLVAHPKDCKQFTNCSHEVTEHMICPPNSVYNIENGYCDLKENVPGCFGDQGNGVNYRGDISISYPNPINLSKPYQSDQASCITSPCLPASQQREFEFSSSSREEKSHDIKQASRALSETNLEKIFEKLKNGSINTHNSIDKKIEVRFSEIENIANDQNNQNIVVTNSDDSKETKFHAVTLSNNHEEIEMTTESLTSEANSQDYSIKVKNNLINAYNSINGVINLNQNEKVDNAINLKKNTTKNLSKQDEHLILNNVTLGDIEATESSKETIERSAMPDTHQPYYITINGKKYHYIYREVQIDQNHSRVRNYNPVPTVVNTNNASEKYPNITSIHKESIDLRSVNNEINEAEPPFPFHYRAPIYSRSMKDNPKLTPLSGQSIRLRNGSDLKHGYVEVQGNKSGWGIVCHTGANWTLTEANIICRQLGYPKGAQMAWKGRLSENEIHPWVATSYVQCLGNETLFQTCKFSDNTECSIQRDAVGIRCLENNEVHCHEDEVFYHGFCYHLAKLDGSSDYTKAEQRCNMRNSSLLYITKQQENNFLSEWLIQKHPSVESVILGGAGFPSVNRSQWYWINSQKINFNFSKWWPGWNNEKILPPLVESRPLCISMKKKFPCDNENQTICQTDYFFWDVQDCMISEKQSYICKRSQV